MTSPEKSMTTRRRRGDSSSGDFEASKADAKAQQREERCLRQTERLRALREARDNIYAKD